MSINLDLGIVIAAGGSSSRFGVKNKLFTLLNNKPVFIYCIQEFIKVVRPENIVITVPKSSKPEFESILSKYQDCNNINVVIGGVSRTQSVINGLNALPKNLNYVAIHDAARPLATCELLEQCYVIAQQHMGAIPGKRVNDTLKRVSKDGIIVNTIDRDNLIAVETPQVFNLESLLDAYDKARENKIEATDDAGIMEYAGHTPRIIINDKLNIKITYPDDILITKSYLNSHSNKH